MSTLVLTLIAGFVLNAGLILYGTILLDRRRRSHLARLFRASSQSSQVPLASKKRRSTGRHDGFVGRIISGLERQIDQSTLRVSVNELLIQAGFALLGIYAGAVLALGIPPLTALPLALLIPVAFVVIILHFARARYRKAFIAELPEALDIFARGLRAGRPVADSMAIVVENASGPVQREFTRCHDEIRMGNSLAETLDRLSVRLPLPEVNFFAVATALQVETGGNLIETMENLATQLRERRKLRKKARALSSEARASAVILASLPFAVGMILAVLNGSYLEPLYADPRGRVMSAAAIGSIALGIFMMVRMGKLDV